MKSHSPLKAHGLGGLPVQFNPYASKKQSCAISIKNCIKDKRFLDALQHALGEKNLGKRHNFFRDIKNAGLKNGQYQIAIDIAILFPDDKEKNIMLKNIYSRLADKIITEQILNFMLEIIKCINDIDTQKRYLDEIISHCGDDELCNLNEKENKDIVDKAKKMLEELGKEHTPIPKCQRHKF